MKTDYSALGRAALQALDRTTAEARQVQRRQLADILHRNAGTRYGRTWGFAELAGVKDFQQRVPLVEYQDCQPYIEAELAGEPRQLTRDSPVYYALTSGSTGTPKYVPVTRQDMAVHYRYIYGGIFGMVQRHYPRLSPQQLFGHILETGEFAKTSLPGGTLCGIRSASLYQWMDREEQFDASDYCVPKEVLFPRELEDLTYLKARFALAQRDITAIHSVFLHRTVRLLEYLLDHWDLLLRDMERGTVDQSIRLRPIWREKLARWLPPDPGRAAELRAMQIPRHPEGMVQRIWPGVRYLVGIGGANFPQYTRAVQRYAPGVPLHHFIYGASEGFLSLAAGMDRPDAYILLPEAGFFEFLPQGDGAAPQHPCTMEELETGRRYELVFTNHSGLYRYRMKDVLEVVDWYGQAPVVRFCYRLNQALNVADEKLNTEQLQAAFAEFAAQVGKPDLPFCAQEDLSVRPGRYLFYLESTQLPGAAALLDRCLARASLGYQGCRNMGEIGPVCVRFVPTGSFQRYEAGLAGQGRTMAQYKPVRVLTDEQSRRFFAAQAAWQEGTESS